MAKSRLHQLSELGQSVWIDFLSRHMLRSGELARVFLAARFDGGDRYVRRLEKIEEMEREFTYG